MLIRPYVRNDAEAIVTLFYETVRTVAAADYTPAQLRAWAPEVPDPAVWHKRMVRRHTLVAEEKGEIIGFAELDRVGHLDMLFCRADVLGRGVGRRLYGKIEQRAREAGLMRIVTDSSITARRFFERQGFHVVKQNRVVRDGVELTNFTMDKRLV